jgi:hypothetical protein
LSALFVVSLWTVLLLQMWVSLKWRLEHDAALLHYAAFLMDHEGRIPYKDIFETSMPGAFAFHYAIGHFYGFDDGPFRRIDLAYLVVLLVSIVDVHAAIRQSASAGRERDVRFALSVARAREQPAT